MCDYISKNARKLNYHKKSKHSTKNALDRAITLKCQECGKEFFDKSNMNRHTRTIHGGISFPCKNCNYKANRKSHLKDHIASKHSESVT